MGEIDKTVEKLNKVLAEAGFPGVILNGLENGGDFWYTNCRISLRFDKDGNYVAPEGEEQWS